MKYFGTGGFRGEANVGLTVEHAYKIGRFVGWYYGANRERKARVIVGKDTRRSSYMFEAALVSGLVASGADAYMLHVIPTPGVAYLTVNTHADAGIVISASHNPFEHNGIKMFSAEGFKLSDALEEEIASESFLRCHRSFLVNQRHILRMEKRDFVMDNGDLVPIGSSDAAATRRKFMDWLFLRNWKNGGAAGMF